MSQNVEIIFLKDSPNYKKPPRIIIEELTAGKRYIESTVSYDQISGISYPKITSQIDFPFMAYYSYGDREQAKVPTIRAEYSNRQLSYFIQTLTSGHYHQAYKWSDKLTFEQITHWFIRYHDKESIPDFIFKFLKANNLTYSIIDEH